MRLRWSAILLILAGLSTPLRADYNNLKAGGTGGDTANRSRVAGLTLVPVKPEARAKVAEARALVAQGKWDKALPVLTEASDLDPVFGLPETARILRLGGRTAELEALVSGLDARKPDDLLRARVLLAAGRRDAAVEVLRASPGVKNATDIAAIHLLGRQLPDAERELLLADALARAPESSGRLEIFLELFAKEKHILENAKEKILPAVESGLAALGPNRAETIRVLDPAIIVWQQGLNYFPLRDYLLAEGPKGGPASHWLATRLLVREERFEEALALITPAEERFREHPLWPLLAEERAEILRSLGRLDETRAVFDSVAANSNEPSLLKEAARAQIAVGDFEAAIKTLDRIDESGLNADARRQNHMLRVLAASKRGDIEGIINAYARAMERPSSDDFEFFHSLIFRTIRETMEHRKIEDSIRARFEADPANTPSVLWVLAAVAAAEGNRPPNQLEALYNAAKARPGDVVVLQLLVEAVIPLAKQLANTPEEQIAAPKGEVQRLNKIATEALNELAVRQPLDPTAYFALIDLYRAKNVDGIPEKILAINARKTVDPRVMGVAAYALAIKGFPEDALVVYDRALEFDPWDYDIKMNRASALTRLGRWKEAAEIYQEVVLNGYRGRNYHIHEMLGRLYDCYDQMKDVPGFIAWINETTSTVNPDWRDETTLDAANLLVNKGRLPDAEPLYQKLIKNAINEDKRVSAYDNYGGALFHANKFEGAVEVYRAALKDFPDGDASLSMAMALAESLDRLDRNDEAIAELERIAGHWPESQRAMSALFRASVVAGKIKDSAREKRLLEAFLATPSTDFTLRRKAEERIADIDNPPTVKKEAP